MAVNALATMMSFLNENLLLAVAFSAIAYIMTRHWFDPKRKNLPPGPNGIPIFGYIPFLPSDYGTKVDQLIKQYGRIFSIRLGSQDVVFICDFEVIKKITMKDVFNHRPEFSFFSLMLPSSLANWNGEEWKEQRKFALRVFHHLGFGKQEVEDAILDEVDDLISRIEVDCHEPIGVARRLGSSVSNVITYLVTGKRYDYNHPIRVMIDDSFLPRGIGSRPDMLGVSYYMPIVAKVCQLLPISSLRGFQSRISKVVGFIVEQIDRTSKTFDAENGDVTCFIEAYLKEEATTKSGKFFDRYHLIGSAYEFFSAGSNTTGDFLTWFMLHMMVHPDVQRKMRQEVDEVIGSKRVSAIYRDAMPYTEAVIQELHRVTSSIPAGLPHAVAEDVNLEGYFLPKGTQLILYAYAIHRNPEYFHDPEEFIPERFISPEGKFIRDERVMNFGYGKRSCPGEPIANTEIFLYIASFLQKFEIAMPKGRKYTTKGEMVFFGRDPKELPIEVLFNRRQTPL